jgi:hypothetical protein
MSLPSIAKAPPPSSAAFGVARDMAQQLGLAESRQRRVLWPWARCIELHMQRDNWQADEIRRLVRWGLDRGYTLDGPAAFFAKAHRIRRHLRNDALREAVASREWI